MQALTTKSFRIRKFSDFSMWIIICELLYVYTDVKKSLKKPKIN